MMKMRFGLRLWSLAAAAGFFFPGPTVQDAHAVWQVISAHPAGASRSYGNGVCGNQLAGEVSRYAMGALHAAVWSESAGEWIDLNPGSPLDDSGACAIRDGSQVGYAFVGDIRRASLWSGTAASWVDLHPPGAESSMALAIHGEHQVGYVEIAVADPDSPTEYHASLWSGSASWVDLAPDGSTDSCAYAVQSQRQGGYASFGGRYHAVLWSGTRESWLDLMPEGSEFSVVHGMDEAQQVGASAVGSYQHACLWRGTAESVVDLNPSGAVGSVSCDAAGGHQVGVVWIGGAMHASVWAGTAESWLDLHALLPAEFTSSAAQSICIDNESTYVIGYGFNSLARRDEALLWIDSAVCTGDFNADGFVDDADCRIFIMAYDRLGCTDPAMPAGCPQDLNRDGLVDDSDFSIFIIAYDALLCP